MQRRLLILLLVVAAVLAVVGLTSGCSTNTESERNATGGWTTIACGSPWAPDYSDAQHVDEQRNLGSELVDACRDHNEAEALIADAMTPAGIVLELTVLGVIAIEIRDGRRRGAPSTNSPITPT